MPILRHITVFPIKAMAGVAVPSAIVTDGGALEWDREFALFDSSGGYLNGKRYKYLHRIATNFDLSERFVDLRVDDDSFWQRFALSDQQQQIAKFLAGRLGLDLELRRNASSGHPDDINAWGPTIISTATLEEITRWFPGISLESVRLRFRINLEIDGVPPFWEDRLFGKPGETVSFRIGDVCIEGVNPCKRCVVPTRDPDTGESYPKFAQTLARNRKAQLPEWANSEQFRIPYRLGVNTRIDKSEAGMTLRTGDPLFLT